MSPRQWLLRFGAIMAQRRCHQWWSTVVQEKLELRHWSTRQVWGGGSSVQTLVNPFRTRVELVEKKEQERFSTPASCRNQRVKYFLKVNEDKDLHYVVMRRRVRRWKGMRLRKHSWNGSILYFLIFWKTLCWKFEKIETSSSILWKKKCNYFLEELKKFLKIEASFLRIV